MYITLKQTIMVFSIKVLVSEALYGREHILLPHSLPYAVAFGHTIIKSLFTLWIFLDSNLATLDRKEIYVTQTEEYPLPHDEMTSNWNRS